MNYCVLTYTVNDDGRIGRKSFIQCADKAEAIAMAGMLEGDHNPGSNKIVRRAMPCATGWSEAGKYTIPLHELRFCKSEVASD